MYPTFSTPGSFEKEQIFCHGQTSSRVLTMPHFRAAFRGRPVGRCQSSHEGARLSQSCPEAAFPLSVPPRPLFRFAMYLSSGFVIRADGGIYSYSFASFVLSYNRTIVVLFCGTHEVGVLGSRHSLQLLFEPLPDPTFSQRRPEDVPPQRFRLLTTTSGVAIQESA